MWSWPFAQPVPMMADQEAYMCFCAVFGKKAVRIGTECRWIRIFMNRKRFE